MKPLVKVLYEDQQAPDVNEFALHVLVRRCVHDHLKWEEDRFEELKHLLVGRAKNGAQNLLKACEDAREARSFQYVFAIFDDDKVRKIPQLGLSAGACKAAIRSAISRRSTYPAQLTTILLGQSMESVVAAVQGCKGQPEPPKLRLPLRDSVLASIAWRPDHVGLRACVMERVPSLGYLVGRLASIVRDRVQV